MNKEPDADAPSCSLEQSDLVSRRERWLRLSERALREKKSTPEGVQLRFRRLAGVETELFYLAESERQCCSFADWSINAEGGELQLAVSAKGDAVATVRALFDEPPPGPASAVEAAAE